MKLIPLPSAAWIVAIHSVSSFAFPPKEPDMRIQPEPGTETNGPCLPKFLFVTDFIFKVFLNYRAKMDNKDLEVVACMVQFTFLYGSQKMGINESMSLN